MYLSKHMCIVYTMHNLHALSGSVVQHNLTFLSAFDLVKHGSLLANKGKFSSTGSPCLYSELPVRPAKVFKVSQSHLVGDPARFLLFIVLTLLRYLIPFVLPL